MSIYKGNTKIARLGKISDRTKENELLSGELSGEYVNNEVTSLREKAFSDYPNLTKLVLNNVTSYGLNACNNNNLREIEMNSLTEIIDKSFVTNAPLLEKLSLPNLQNIKTTSGSAISTSFIYGTNLEKIELPNLENISITRIPTFIANCQNLKYVKFNKLNNLYTSTSSTFSSNCPNFKYVENDKYFTINSQYNAPHTFAPIEYRDEFVSGSYWPNRTIIYKIKPNEDISIGVYSMKNLFTGDFYATKDDAIDQTNKYTGTLLANNEYYLRNVIPNVVYGDVATDTTLSKTINCGIGDNLIACVVYRSTFTAPEGWSLVDEAPMISTGTTDQYMAIYKKVAESTSETFTATQSTSGRMYLSLINIKTNTVQPISNYNTSGTFNFGETLNVTKTTSNSIIYFTSNITSLTSKVYSITGNYDEEIYYGGGYRVGFVFSSKSINTSFGIRFNLNTGSTLYNTLGVELI